MQTGVSRSYGRWLPRSGPGSAICAKYPECRIRQPSMHIATAPELLLEKPGTSPPAASPPEERGPRRGALIGSGFDLQRRPPVRPGRVTIDFVEGAMTA